MCQCRPRSRPRRSWTSSLLLGVVVVLSGCGTADSPGVPAGDPVSVDLLGTVASLEGHDWPTRQDGTSSEAAAVERPVVVEVRVGEDRVFEAPSQLTFFGQRQSEVVRVEVQPPAELASLPATIDDVEALLVGNDALDEELTEALESWRSHEETADLEWPSSGDRLSERVELAPGVDLAVWLRQRGDEGWFYTVSLSRPVETWPLDP